MTPSVDHVLFACSESVAQAVLGVHAVSREFDLSPEMALLALLAHVKGFPINSLLDVMSRPAFVAGEGAR